MTQLPDTITKARARLLVRAPFFGSIALGLGWVNAPEVRTMATDGRRIWFNPAWCEKHGVERIMGVTAHEVLHVVNKHHLRRGTRDPGLWNLAADLMINRVLEGDGYVLPPGLMFDREGRFAGLATETIYARLLEELEQNPSNRPENGRDSGGGSGRHGGTQADESPDGGDADGEAGGGVRPADIWGEVRDLTTDTGQKLSPAERVQAEHDLDVRIRQAAAAARRAGKFPAGLGEMIEAAADRVDWRDKFRMSFDGTLRGEVSWARPNRRFIQHGLYLPGWRRSGAGRVAFVLDTSGSISARELAVYTAGVLGILEETGPEQVALIQCDTAVRDVAFLQPGETFDRIEVVGRGGTRFQPAFDWIAASGFGPNVIVYATDLVCCETPEDPGVPVIWLTPSRGRAIPFGTIVEVTL
nr:VWA-like domain-containing protein [uncultured Rhodopila sp.]